jgi:hypothetical protein
MVDVHSRDRVGASSVTAVRQGLAVRLSRVTLSTCSWKIRRTVLRSIRAEAMTACGTA